MTRLSPTVPRALPAVLLAVSLAMGCSPSSRSPSEEGPSGSSPPPTTGSDASTGGPTGAGGPDIISFGTDVTSLTAGQSVTFSAVVTDPGGVNQLAGGVLTSADGGITYGAFGVSAQKGAYELVVSWSAIDAASPISFVGEQTLPFVATFFDEAGLQASQEVDIVLQCDGAGGGACAGQCTDVQSDVANCGACGVACSPGDTCAGGVCHTVASVMAAAGSCAQICAALPHANSRCASDCSQLGGGGAIVGTVEFDTGCSEDIIQNLTSCDESPPAYLYAPGVYLCDLTVMGCCCDYGM